MNLNKPRFKIIPILSAFFILAFFASPAFAQTPSIATQVGVTVSSIQHTMSVNPEVSLLGSSFSSSLVGGAPFCTSGLLGTILCYPPSFLKTAYNFPSTSGKGALTGGGQTVVIVDAFGSPTIQSDLNTYDAAFGLPPTTITILCGPTWTGAATDTCPVTTIADLSTAPNALLCGATGWAEETTLDVTMVHSLAPGAHIVLLVANDCMNTSLVAAEQAIVNQPQYRGSIMTQSFGEPDDLVDCTAGVITASGYFVCTATDPSLLTPWDTVYQTAALNHWTVIASTGDLGANENAEVQGTIELTPSFPSTNPLVLAAGGTEGSPYGGEYGPPPGSGGTFTCAAGATCDTGLVVINGGANGCGTAIRPGEPTSCYPVGYGGEQTWNEFASLYSFEGGYTLAASGGGVSSLYSRPLYQILTPYTYTTLLGNMVQATGRTVPDVSFNSAINGGVMAYLGFINGGDWAVFGGTSASSPAWAAIMALADQAAGQPLGFVNPAIYLIGLANPLIHAFHDITQGTNAVCLGLCGEDGFVAQRGYDLTTGWGTPDVTNFIQALTGH